MSFARETYYLDLCQAERHLLHKKMHTENGGTINGK
ncbi:hypothetical protein ACUXIC_002204 [Enterococcus lactis]